MTQNNPLVEGQEWVIASERRERGNQRARNPRIMKDSMPLDCNAYARNDEKRRT